MPRPGNTTKIIAAIGGALVIVLLAATLVTLKSQLDTANQQNARIGRLLSESKPVLDDATPTLDEVRSSLGSARGGLRRASRLADEALPLVRELQRAGLDEAAATLQALISSLTDQDRIVKTLDTTQSLLAQLNETEFPRRTGEAFEDVRSVENRTKALLRVQLKTLDIQRRTFDTQTQSLAALRESLAVQREALRHVRSLDRKLGGPLPEQ